MWVKELFDLKVTDLRREFKRTFVDHWESFDAAGKRLKERFLNGVLEAERTEFLDRQSYERLLEGSCYRNGYWTRHIVLKDGRLELRMPRHRGVRYESKVIARYQRRTLDEDRALLNVFLCGDQAATVLGAQAPECGVCAQKEPAGAVHQGGAGDL